MTDRPMIFSGPMIRALLEGRKTQTRRVLTLGGRRPDYIGPRGCTAYSACWGWNDGEGGFILADRDPDDPRAATWHDYSASWRPGDRAWVRETFNQSGPAWPNLKQGLGRLHYRADRDHGWQACWGNWRSPIHMPRWASRLTLIVTDVRVQRLQEISEDDARAEGVGTDTSLHIDIGELPAVRASWNGMICSSHVDAMRQTWSAIHGVGAWGADPWICALTFTVHRSNIDQMEAA